MSRPPTGRRLHTAAFDVLVAIRGLTSAKVAEETLLSQGHISDMRAGRRMVTPPTANALADALALPNAEAILWPAAAVERSEVAA